MKDVKEEKKCPCEQCIHGTYMIIEKEWWCDKHLKYASQMERNRRCEKFETISGQVAKLSPVTPARKKGKWIDTDATILNRQGYLVHEVICSECNSISYFRTMGNKYIGANYCPNCGTKMEK